MKKQILWFRDLLFVLKLSLFIEDDRKIPGKRINADADQAYDRQYSEKIYLLRGRFRHYLRSRNASAADDSDHDVISKSAFFNAVFKYKREAYG